MTKLEEFISYASGLPAKRREEVEGILSTIMSTSNDAVSLSLAQEKEIQRRLDDPNPGYASSQEVEAVLGRPVGL